MSLRIGIVAGEASGDLLAADLMRAIQARVPDVQFEGIAGPLMQAAGCQMLYPAEKLAVMGLVEVLGHLPELLRIRRALRRRFLARPPDLFIGVDAPDFNLALERRLKRAGIPTAHYVSPSVWAWRQYRVRKIARSLDLMLTLFPFEADFYRAHQVPVRFVGHPLADRIPERCQCRAVRLALKLPEQGRILALLPGSRRSEVRRLAEPFLGAAQWLRHQLPDLQFVAPL
ncbi:MAG TPA: lipid-A-disaccharide synthase, partial [Gammaproteobacteria bacterium]